jgi:hypothetical protein
MTQDAPRASTARQLLPAITPWFAQAFDRYAPPDEINWELGLIQFPTKTPGQFQSLVAVYADIPGQVLRTAIMASAQIQPYGMEPEGVDQFVRDFVENLRLSRSQQNETMIRDAEQAARNGRTPPPGGLIVPGQG